MSATKVLNVTRLTRSVVIAGVFLTGSLLVSCGLFKPECTGDDPACNQILFALRPRAAYGRVLYASTTGGTDHRVYAFAMNRNTGALTALGTPVGAGNDPTTLTIDPSGRFLYATGSATGANVYPYTIQSDGTLMPGTAITASGTAPRQMVFSADPTVAVLQYAGGATGQVAALSIDPVTGAPGTQGTPFGLGCTPSSLVVDPFGKFVYTPSILIPQAMFALKVDPATKTLSQIGTSLNLPAVNPGKQTITPDSKFLYLSVPSAGTSNVIGYNRQSDGSLTQISTIFPLDTVAQTANDITTHPKGGVIYTLTSGNKIFAHAVDASGNLTTLMAGGLGTSNGPTAMTIEPGGNYIYVFANNAAGTGVIDIFQINRDGTLQTRPDISPVTVNPTPNGNALTVLPAYDW